MGTCTHHVHGGYLQGSISSYGTVVMGNCKPPHIGRKPDSGLLEEQQESYPWSHLSIPGRMNFMFCGFYHNKVCACVNKRIYFIKLNSTELKEWNIGQVKRKKVPRPFPPKASNLNLRTLQAPKWLWWAVWTKNDSFSSWIAHNLPSPLPTDPLPIGSLVSQTFSWLHSLALGLSLLPVFLLF